MDFLSKFLQRKPPKSGGGSPSASSTPTVPIKPDHEAHVQFAREFVVELVETVPKKSDKAALAKVGDKEDIVSLKSVSPSEGSFQSVNSVTENISLPDLLQPESVYKKQADTDTDTTEYESAAETDPLDASSPIENLIAEDIITGFHEALDKKNSPSEEQKPPTDNSVSQTSEPSPLSEAYEDVGDTLPKSGSENEVKSLDISGLCLRVSNLCLDSPKRSEGSETPGSLNKSETVVNNSVVTEQSFGSVSDSTFLIDDKAAKLNDSLGDPPGDCKLKTQIESVTSTDLSNVISENALSSPLKTPDQSSLDFTGSETSLNKEESKNTHEISEVTSSPPEVTSASSEVFQAESSVVKEGDTCLDVTSTKVSEELPSKSSEVLPENTSVVQSVILPEKLQLLPAEIKQISVSSTNNLEPQSAYTDELTKSFEKEQLDAPSENTLHTISKFTDELKVEDSFEKVSCVKVADESGESFELKEKTSVVSPLKVAECSEEVKSNDISELVDLLITQTEELSLQKLETLSGDDLNLTPAKSAEAVLRSLQESSKKLDDVSEKTVESVSVIPTEVAEEKCEVSQVNLTETEPEITVLNETLSTKLEVTEATGEQVTSALSPGILTVKLVEEALKLEEKPVDETKLKYPEEEKLLETADKQIESVVSDVTQLTLKSQENKVNTCDTADRAQEWTSETDICSSESIPVEETPSVASVTNSIDEKLLESKDFSASFEIVSTDKEVPLELCEDKVQVETVDSTKGLFENQSFVKDSTSEVGASDCNFQKTEKECEVVKRTPTVLTELFEICNRQQKDLELGDEKFVDGREFFNPPSNSTNLNETVVVGRSLNELSDTIVSENYGDFDESITEEAEKISQEIINASQLSDSSVKSSEGDTQQISEMADIRGDVDDVNPFLSQSSLRRSPPSSTKHSPRSCSPADSPRVRSKLASVNQTRENNVSYDGAGDASPRPRLGKNSPDCRNLSNRVSSLEGSPKNSVINSEINQSEAGPEIADDGHVQTGDVFKDPSTFDFLNSVGNSNVVSDLRKESLYVKFDPLVGGARTVDQSVPLPPAVEAKSNNIGHSANSSPHDSFSNNITPPTNAALSMVDKLISLSPSPRKREVETPVKQVITPVTTPVRENYPDNSSMLEELHLLREILAKQDEKHKEDILMQQQKLEVLQAQVKEYEDRETKLNKKVAEKAQGQKQMSIIMEEYEKTISRLVAEKEQERQAHELDRSSLLKERDTAMGHLANIEIAFSDLHKKYERSKTVIEGFKKNEEVLRASLAEYEATIRKQEQKYDVLKSHAMGQLENANQELDSVRRSQQAETAKLKAMLKKAEVKTSSLEEMLEQKIKENQELASICDELINKVGSSE